MDRTILKALHVILLSLGLAVVFNFLFFDKLIGLSILIFTVVLLGAMFLLGKGQNFSFQKSGWLILLILFFALMPAIHANEPLTFFNICAMLGLLILLAHELIGTPTIFLRFRNYFLMIFAPFRMLRRALSTLSLVGQLQSSVGSRDLLLRIVKGIVMAVPVLVIFGILFSQADLAFSQFINGLIDIRISEHTIQYSVLLLIAFAAGLSFLSYIFFPGSSSVVRLDGEPDNSVESGKGIEVMVLLGLVSTLFLIFIGFQITYLFGGSTNVVNAGFTYAEYARRGFWELLVVAILSLLILLASEKYARAEMKRDKRFLVPALVMIVEVLVLIASAFKRLSLYIDAYGMTLSRFYVAGFIILVLALFILLAVKFMRSKSEQFFAFSMLLSVLVFLAVVNIINPDAFVAKSNIEQYNRTGKIDVLYVGKLSTDAEPWKVELYNRLEGEDKEVLGKLLLKQRDRLQEYDLDWRSANLSRSRALGLLQGLK
jgi:hypothetical protein